MNDQTPKRAADILAERLFQAGCRYAFGMPGGEVLTMVDALGRAGIEFVLTRHENAAGFMAEGVWHRTGAPGILVATVGPGALNAVNAVANAEQDRVPLIVITGAVDADEAETYTHQVLDHRAVFAPVTKAGFTITSNAVGVVADKAVAIACEPRPGPVHLDLPISVADTKVRTADRPMRTPAVPTVPAAGVAFEEARDALAKAQRPVMIVGVDAVNEDAAPAIQTLAEAQGIPVITTYKAKGVLPEDHALALGGAGLSPLADRHLLPFVQSADVILCAGYDPIEMRVGWRNVWDPARQTVIDVTAVPNRHYVHQGTFNIVASIAPTLAALSEGAPERTVWSNGEIPALNAALADAFPTDEAWGAAAVIDECRKSLPRDALATADSGAHRILLSQMWQCYEPRGLMQSSGLCTMGCAVPLAMGAEIADPDRTVASFSGDAGFLMVVGELATAAELGLRTIFVVFNDASLALIELKQRQRQLTNSGVDFAVSDIAAIGRAFGGNGFDARNRAELRTALDAALGADTFTVIAARIDRGAYDGRL